MYDITTYGLEAWDELVRRRLDLIIDPFVFRVGQFFLEGEQEGADRWHAIESDLGALVSFFDLLVLHDRLPAFNYADTVDRPDIDETVELRDRLGDVLNTEGDKTPVHVDVEHHMYRQAKEAAIEQLARRMREGPFMPRVTADEILDALPAAPAGADLRGCGPVREGAQGPRQSGQQGRRPSAPWHECTGACGMDDRPAAIRSARKLLARSVRAEHELKSELGAELKKVWRPPGRDDGEAGGHRRGRCAGR